MERSIQGSLKDAHISLDADSLRMALILLLAMPRRLFWKDLHYSCLTARLRTVTVKELKQTAPGGCVK